MHKVNDHSCLYLKAVLIKPISALPSSQVYTLNSVCIWTLHLRILQVIDRVFPVKANLLWMLMKNRRILLGEEVNRILDFADGMVKEEDGERIFDRLDDFLHFPNGTVYINREAYIQPRTAVRWWSWFWPKEMTDHLLVHEYLGHYHRRATLLTIMPVSNGHGRQSNRVYIFTSKLGSSTRFQFFKEGLMKNKLNKNK